MTIDDRITTLAEIHPLLPEKLKMDEEERTRDGLKYKLLYEKTYASGNVDAYDSSVIAKDNAEAIQRAQDKLYLKDALASWSTNITDAVLISPTGERLLVPPFSKKGEEK